MEEFSSYFSWINDDFDKYEMCGLNDSERYSHCPQAQESNWQDYAYYVTKISASAGMILSSGYLVNKGYLSPKFLQWGLMLVSAKILSALSPFELLQEYVDVASMRSFIVGSNVLVSQALTDSAEVRAFDRIKATVVMSLFNDALNFIDRECGKIYSGILQIEPVNIVDDVKHLSYYVFKNGSLRCIKETTKFLFLSLHENYLEHIIPTASFINNWTSTFISTFISDYVKLTCFESVDFFSISVVITETVSASAKGLGSAIAKRYNLSPDIIAALGVLGGHTSYFILNNWVFDEQVIDNEPYIN